MLSHYPGANLLPPRTKSTASKLAQHRLALPDRPSQGWVADKVSEIAADDVSQQAVGYWETSKVDLRKVHPRRLRAYASVLRITLAELAEAAGYTVEALFPDSTDALNRSGLMPVAGALRVAVRGFAAAGHGSEINPFAPILGYDHVDPELYKDSMLILQVDGDSMQRSGQVNSIEPGDWIYVDKSEMDLQDGKIFVVDVEGMGVLVKRVKQWPDGWVLISDNMAYPPIKPDFARVIGRVYYRQPKGEKL